MTTRTRKPRARRYDHPLPTREVAEEVWAMHRARRYLDAMIEARHIDPDDEASPIEREAWDDARRS